jgi:hypothetical protein
MSKLVRIVIGISFCLALVFWYDTEFLRAVDFGFNTVEQFAVVSSSSSSSPWSSQQQAIISNNNNNNHNNQSRTSRADYDSDYHDYVVPPEKTMICYNSQGTAANYGRIRDRLERAFNNTEETYQFVYHAFDRPCQGCLHLLKSSVPAEGRNAAVYETVTSQNWNKCKYLVFFDDDAYLLPTSVKNLYKSTPKTDDSRTLLAWGQVHDMLLQESTTYPLISPQSEKWDSATGKKSSYQSCVDEVWWAIRHDHVDFVYPLSTVGRENYWLTNVAMWFVMEKCFPAGVLVDPRWYTKNEAHRYSPDAFKKRSIYTDSAWRNQHMVEMLNRDYGPIGPFTVTKETWLEHSCTIKPQPSVGVHPRCKALSEERFRKWLSGELIP